MPLKNNFQYNTKLRFRLKKLKICTRSAIRSGILYLDAKTIYDMFLAIKMKQPITSTYLTVNGDAIENTGIYKMPTGVTMREMIELAKTKNTYEYVDSYVYNAMEAHNDKISFEKEISEESDEKKKQELIDQMNKKDAEAEETIFSKMGETLEYYNNCLGVIYEVKGHTRSGIYSQHNVITPATSALIMVTRNTLKKL